MREAKENSEEYLAEAERDMESLYFHVVEKIWGTG